MEDTLRDQTYSVIIDITGLNPCFNGRYSQRCPKLIIKTKSCLNPCFNGRYSQRKFGSKIQKPNKVLILVLMEDTLRE